MAKKASPLLQLNLKSLTLTEQPTLEKYTQIKKKKVPKRVWADLSWSDSKTSVIVQLLLWLYRHYQQAI